MSTIARCAAFQNIFVYLGRDEQKLAQVFSRLGYVMQPVLRATAQPSPIDDGILEFLRRTPKAAAQ